MKKLLFMSCLCLLLLKLRMSNYYLSLQSYAWKYVNSDKSDDLKTIFLWTPFFGDATFGIRSIVNEEVKFPFSLEKFDCPEKRCVITNDRTLKKSEEIQAFIFHDRDLNLSDIPDPRLPSQYYIYFNQESPSYNDLDPSIIKSLHKFFNLSMTYKTNSDVPVPYGKVVQVVPHPTSRQELEKLIMDFGVANKHLAVKEKSESFVTQFASNCNTHSKRKATVQNNLILQSLQLTIALREFIISSLSKLLKVDIFGECGPLNCDKKDETCYSKIEKTYKFYLSFENSICEDYITEKYFNILPFNIIPVMLNGANMTNHAPPHSYINAEDFSSTKELAKYLKKVASNDSLFASYFWWRDYYKRESEIMWCSLCQFLHQPQREDQVRHFDVEEHLDKSHTCRQAMIA